MYFITKAQNLAYNTVKVLFWVSKSNNIRESYNKYKHLSIKMIIYKSGYLIKFSNKAK